MFPSVPVISQSMNLILAKPRQNNETYKYVNFYMFVLMLCLLFIFCVVDFVLKDPREKDDDKKEEVLEHKLE